MEFTEFSYNGMWFREMKFYKTGDIKQGHIHNRDHITLFAYGIFRITDANTGDIIAERLEGPSRFIVKKDIAHSIELLSDHGIAYCVENVPCGETMVTKNITKRTENVNPIR